VRRATARSGEVGCTEAQFNSTVVHSAGLCARYLAHRVYQIIETAWGFWPGDGLSRRRCNQPASSIRRQLAQRGPPSSGPSVNTVAVLLDSNVRPARATVAGRCNECLLNQSGTIVPVFVPGKTDLGCRFRQVRRSLGPYITFRKRIIFSKRTDANSLVDVVYKTAALLLRFQGLKRPRFREVDNVDADRSS
jgi:hypothetical protein